MKKHLGIPQFVTLLFAVISPAMTFRSANDALAYTGYAVDTGNTTVVTEYSFYEGSGSTAYNTGTDDGGGDATSTNSVSFTIRCVLQSPRGES